MGVTRSIGRRLGKQLAPRATSVAPGLSASFVRQALRRAVDGVGPLASAAKVADKHLATHEGVVERAVRSLIDDHVRLAGAQGFLTNIGGLVTATVAVPANISGLAVLQLRMVAGIAHLRGYDLTDPRVHNAVLVTLLGEDAVDRLVRKHTLPAPPMALATAPAHDPAVDAAVSREVASHLVGRVTGRRLAATVGRRVPVVGGLVGMGTDGFATWQVGDYADGELRPRANR